MAWIKMKDKFNNILTIPETMYRDVYENNDAYSIVEDVKKVSEIISKPFSNKEEVIVKKESVEDVTDLPNNGRSKDTSVKRINKKIAVQQS